MTWPEPQDGLPPLDTLSGRDGVVHLLGEPIAQRWTDDAKREIRDSRVLSTRNLVTALGELPEGERPACSYPSPARASTDIAGTSGSTSRQPGPVCFLAQLSARLGGRGAPGGGARRRVVLNRTGMVLSALRRRARR